MTEQQTDDNKLITPSTEQTGDHKDLKWPSKPPKLQYEVLAAAVYDDLAMEMQKRYPSRFRYHKSSWAKFSDGMDNIELGGFTPINLIRGRHVLLLSSFHNNDVILQLFHAMIVLQQSFIESLTVVLPFYPVATMERVLKEGQIATANTTAQLFCGLPSGGKPIRLIIYDLHTLQNRFYWNSSCVADLRTAVPLLLSELKRSGSKIDCIGFPDDGAAKRFGCLFPDYKSHLVCAKKRDGDKRSVTVHDGDAKGKHVIIVDDLVRTGGTLIEAAEVIKAQGAKSVSVFCVHAVFPHQSWKQFTKTGKHHGVLSHFYITNSCPQVTVELPKDDVFVILDLLPQIEADL